LKDKPLCNFGNEQSMFNQRIYESELFNDEGNLNPCYTSNNTLIVGVYIRTYKYDEGLTLYNNNIKYLLYFILFYIYFIFIFIYFFIIVFKK